MFFSFPPPPKVRLTNFRKSCCPHENSIFYISTLGMISNALTKEPDFFSFPPLCKTDVCFATYRMLILSAVTRNLFCHLPHANFECGHWKSCIVFPLCGLCLFDKNLEKYLQNCRAGRHTICAPLRLYFRISEARHGVTFFTVRDGAMT